MPDTTPKPVAATRPDDPTPIDALFPAQDASGAMAGRASVSGACGPEPRV
ncbi:MAG: hypothetical protein ACRDRH_01185 [Pseudonocardia sp.]